MPEKITTPAHLLVPRTCPVCGTVFMVKASRLAHGRGKHCSYACRAIGIRTHGETLAGMKHSPEYMAWSSIKTRCLNPAAEQYPDYGGRGITICPAWRDDFAAFLADVGRRPSPQHSIDRIDNEGDYEPGNVRWATSEEQQGNRRVSVLVTFNGETRSVGAWARLVGINKTRLYRRLEAGWSPERALTTPARPYRR